MSSDSQPIDFNIFPEKLTVKEENKLAREHTHEARCALAMHSMREAMKYTKRCCRDSIPEDALQSLCYDALMCAAPRFKPNWARFFAFAKADLRGAIRKYFNGLRVVKKSEVTSRECLEEAIAVSRKKKGDEEVVEDVELHTGEFTEPEFRLIELREQWALVEPLLKSSLLSKHEKMVLDLTYKSGFAFKATAAKLGVSPSAVQSTHAGALRKIRNKLMASKRLFDSTIDSATDTSI